MSLLKWPLVALEMGAGAHCACGPRRAARWASVWSTLGALEEQILDAPAPRMAGQVKETVGEVFSQDRFQQRLAKQMIEVRKGPVAVGGYVPMIVVELAVSSGEAGSSGPGERDTTDNAATKCLLVKHGLLESKSRVPRQNPKSKGLLVKLGLLGPEQTIRLVLTMQQLQKLLVKLGLWGSPSTVSALAVSSGEAGSARPGEKAQSTIPRQNLLSQYPLVKLSLLGQNEELEQRRHCSRRSAC